MPSWLAPWKTLQRSLFDEPAEAPDLAPAASPVAASDAAETAPARTLHDGLAGEVFRHPRAQRDVRLDGHLVAYQMRRARRRSSRFGDRKNSCPIAYLGQA